SVVRPWGMLIAGLVPQALGEEWSAQNKFANRCQGLRGRIRDNCMAASRKSFEANEMLGQGRCDVSLTFDGCHRIFFSTHDKGWALHPRKVRDHVERVIFATGPCEPLKNLVIANSSPRYVGIARSTRVERKGET